MWHFNPFRVGVKTVLTPLAPVPPRSKTEGRGRLGRKADANFSSLLQALHPVAQCVLILPLDAEEIQLTLFIRNLSQRLPDI